MNPVKVFSKTNCMQCKMVKRYLNQNQISFEEINLDEQPEMIDVLKAQGITSVPVISAGDITVLGFRPDQLKLLAS